MNHHFAESGRFVRQGFPEAIYSPGKTLEQILKISAELLKGEGPVIITRAEKKLYSGVKRKYKKARFFPLAGIILLKAAKIAHKDGRYLCVVTAGTTDIPVAEEVAVTAEVLGNKVERIYDVGVAGVHRVLKHSDILCAASCVVVCAGMEGALPSVVGGLVGCPVIGVPTSVGYGASFKGVSALLSMLNSCAPNVSVVNIDDGFGAGIVASLINKQRR